MECRAVGFFPKISLLAAGRHRDGSSRGRKTPENQLGIYFHSVSLPKMEEAISAPKTLDDHINYMTNDELKPLFRKALDQIKGLEPGIEAHNRTQYVSFHFKGRQIGYLMPTRKAFDVAAVITDDNGRITNYEPVRVETGDEDYSEILEKIRKTYEIVK